MDIRWKYIEMELSHFSLYTRTYLQKLVSPTQEIRPRKNLRFDIAMTIIGHSV